MSGNADFPAQDRADHEGGRVTFVGAGPGVADLITVRGARALQTADVVVWAASLVAPEVLDYAAQHAEIVDSATLTLESTVDIYRRAAAGGHHVVRLHSGDPALWGAMQEQIERCRELDLAVEVVPGVSAYAAVAAAVQRELTVPEVAQSVVLTRLEGGKTPMPAGETVAGFAAHGATMAVFLSAARARQLAAELVAGGYSPDTPVVVGYRVTWPDELMLRCTVDTLAEAVRAHKLWKHTLFLVGPALAARGSRSHLYHPGHFHGFRRADPTARQALRQARRD
jgi:precorrin-4/cobalt-precorrin-4 C11-methyltransferase